MNIQVGHPELAWLLLLLPLIGLVLVYSSLSRWQALKAFGLEARRNAVSFFGAVSGVCLLAGLALLVFASMDIRWGKTKKKVPQKGLEVVFALDVSRSMLAEDAKPNRLSRAKQQIKDMVAEMAGDRIGLVVFAGEAKQSVPLTSHYNDFLQGLDSVTPDSVSRGGSHLGVAIAESAEAFLDKTNDHKTVVLLTDGEDLESQPVELAKKFHAENGLRVFTVGLGDMGQGARIPDADSRSSQFVEHGGEQVWSKLNGAILREIATATNAAYIPAGTKRVNMADVYYSYIANIEKSEFETAEIDTYIPRFQWFAFPALLLLSTHVSLSNRKLKTNQKSKRSSSTTDNNRGGIVSKPLVAAKVATVAIMLTPGFSVAQSVVQSVETSIESKINSANELVRQDKPIEAIDAYNEIDKSEEARKYADELNYNLAVAHYRNSDIVAAATLFQETAKSANDEIAANSRYNLGNCKFANATSLLQEDPQAAIGELEQAVGHYRSSLRLDRKKAEARENLERAIKLIQQLRDQQEQQQKQQSQDKQQEKNENQDQEQKSQEQQSESSEENQSQDESEEQDSEQQQGSESQEQDNQSQRDQQSNGQQQSDDQKSYDQQQQASDQNSSGNQNQKSQPQERSQNTQDEQQTDDQRSVESETSGKGDDAPEGQLSSAEQQAMDPENMKDLAEQQKDNGMMTRQEALKLLQAVRDRDMLRRLQEQRRQRRRRVKVDKDW